MATACPAGVGKGTQCQLLVNEFGFAHLSAGDLLRQAIRQGTAESDNLSAIIQSGRIVPSQVQISARRSTENRKAAGPSTELTQALTSRLGSQCILEASSALLVCHRA
jgi:adenylate kinase family enzyme